MREAWLQRQRGKETKAQSSSLWCAPSPAVRLIPKISSSSASKSRALAAADAPARAPPLDRTLETPLSFSSSWKSTQSFQHVGQRRGSCRRATHGEDVNGLGEVRDTAAILVTAFAPRARGELVSLAKATNPFLQILLPCMRGHGKRGVSPRRAGMSNRTTR